MQLARVLASIVFACLVGCSQANTEGPSAVWALSSVSKTSNGPNPACPSQDFSQFLIAFEASAEVQKRFTALPLQSDSIDAGAEPEPRTVTRGLRPPELIFPLMHTAQQQRDEGLTLSRQKLDGQMVVTVSKPDTDYQVSYYFRQNAGCWQLYRKFDESI